MQKPSPSHNDPLCARVFLTIALLIGLHLFAGCTNAKDHPVAENEAAKQVEAVKAKAKAEDDAKGWLYASPYETIFIQWAKVGSEFKGQMQTFRQLDGAPPRTETDTLAVEGIIDGKKIVLKLKREGLDRFFGERTITGQIDDDALTLTFPRKDGTLQATAFRPASVTDFNKSVRIIQSTVRQLSDAHQQEVARATELTAAARKASAEREAVSSAHNRVISIANDVRSAVGELPGKDYYAEVLGNFDKGVADMLTTFEALKRRANQPLTDSEYRGLESNLRGMASQLRRIDSVQRYFESQLRSVEGELQSVEGRLSRLRAAWKELSQATEANTSGGPKSEITEESIAKAIEAAQIEMNKVAVARTDAQRLAAAYNKKAKDVYNQAEQFVKQLDPSGR